MLTAALQAQRWDAGMRTVRSLDAEREGEEWSLWAKGRLRLLDWGERRKTPNDLKKLGGFFFSILDLAPSNLTVHIPAILTDWRE